MSMVLHSSKNHDWGTPWPVFNKLHEEFGFTIDLAADSENKKLDRYYSIAENSLLQSWDSEIGFCNPPYGKSIPLWLDKAMQAKNSIIVMLIPARTETRWWAKFWDYGEHKPTAGVEVRFVFKRINFIKSDIAKSNGTFPSAIVIFNSRS